MAYHGTTVVEVRAWGERVGALAASGRRGAYGFEYAPEWCRGGTELAPLLMPAVPRRTYAFPDLSVETFQGLPPMIADSLPDRFGNSVVNAYLARNGISLSQITALDRLAYLGDRGLGALEFLPDTAPHDPTPTALDLGELVSSARRAVHGSLATEAESEDALRQIIEVGTSAGGARAKAIVNFDPSTHELISGHAVGGRGYQPWLLKFDGIDDRSQLVETGNYGRVEYAYSLMAKAAGIVMPDTRLLEENGRAHFMTRRFDRTDDGRKLHLQSLCGIAGLDYNQAGTHDYAQYFQVIAELGLGAEALTQAFVRMAFNAGAANCDDHTKNFAFLMGAGGQWQLAPAYDVTYAYNPDSPWVNQHQMSVEGRFRDIGRVELLALAERFDVPGALAALPRIADVIDAWPTFAEEAGVPSTMAGRIRADLRPELLRR